MKHGRTARVRLTEVNTEHAKAFSPRERAATRALAKRLAREATPALVRLADARPGLELVERLVPSRETLLQYALDEQHNVPRKGGLKSGQRRRMKANATLRDVEAKKLKLGLSDKAAARVVLQETEPDWLTLADSERARKVQNLAQAVSNARRKAKKKL